MPKRHHTSFINYPSPYPLLLCSFSKGLQLYIPDPATLQSVYSERLGQDPNSPFPYWAKVWAAGKALASFLLTVPELSTNKTILEIGAGIGLPSFSIASNAAQLIISDQDPEAVTLMEKNIALLGLTHASAKCIDWNHFPSDLSADTILLSDVNYAPEQFESLLKLIRQWLDAGSTVILSTPQRIMGAPFVTALTNYIVQQTTCSIEEAGGMTDVSIFVLQNIKSFL